MHVSSCTTSPAYLIYQSFSMFPFRRTISGWVLPCECSTARVVGVGVLTPTLKSGLPGRAVNVYLLARDPAFD